MRDLQEQFQFANLRTISPAGFPAPWTTDGTDACCIVRGHNRVAVACVYLEGEPGGRTAANPLTRYKARRIAGKGTKTSGSFKDGPPT
jgi:hypothetical protein